MRIIAFDIGEKRIGVAVSDPLGITSAPRAFIPASGDDRDVNAMAAAAFAEGAVAIVLGLPRRTDGSIGKEAQRITDLASKLQELTGLEVVLFDERFTTRIAERTLLEANVSRRKRKACVDSMVAQIILQEYLDSRRRS
ncbi:MAG: Holliday junction resolvase RuvX [Bacillota bacterium]